MRTPLLRYTSGFLSQPADSLLLNHRYVSGIPDSPGIFWVLLPCKLENLIHFPEECAVTEAISIKLRPQANRVADGRYDHLFRHVRFTPERPYKLRFAEYLLPPCHRGQRKSRLNEI